jgi:hypothetical protein
MAQTLLQKLHIRPGDRVAVLNAPDSATGLTMEIPLDVSVSHELQGTFQQIHCFVSNRAELERLVPQAIPALESPGFFWIYFPKKSSKMQTDLSRDTGWETMREAGFRPVSLIALDDTWSALAFHRASAVPSRSTSRKHQENKKYIDRKRRTLKLPPDLGKQFAHNRRAAERFRRLSFTHRREYVEWILEAKRPDTRTRRIKKLVTRLTKGGK